MLPGFRFLFAAVVLSLSILVFGLGAAALLRAAHEQFASLPTRRAPAEPVFTRQNDAPLPTLALLRFDPPAVEETPEIMPAAAAPETVTPAVQAPDAAPVEAEKLAALPEEPMSTEATPAAPATETTAATPAAAVEPAPSLVPQEEVKVAAIAEAPQPSTATAPVPTNETPSPGASIAATRIATLGGPTVIVDEKAAAKAADAKSDRSVIRKRAAQRARERRRIAARRARLAALRAALAAQQLQANPFGQTTTTRTAQ